MDAKSVINNVIDNNIWENAIWVNKEEKVFFVPIWRCGNTSFMYLAEDYDFELVKDFDVSDYTGFAFVRSPMKRIIGQLERAYENNNPTDYVDTTSIIQYVSKLLSEAAKGNWIDMHMRPQYDFLKNYNCEYYLDLDSETSLSTNHVFIDKVVSDFRSRKIWVDDGDHSKGKRNRSQAKDRFINIAKNQILDEASLKIIYETYKEDYELYESI